MVDLSAGSRTRVWVGTIAGTLLCVAVALFVDSFNFHNLDEEALRRSISVDIGLPVILASPLLFLLLSKIRQLALAHAEMARLASTDSLTAVLNRGAFNYLVEAYLERFPIEALSKGALLVIDADHFKGINDSLGHQEGDKALKLIAITIQGALRASDVLGRLGGEEFGVFMPGATRPQALQVAERIRTQIKATPFPSTDDHMLSVSIGGVSFRNESHYDRLFAIADRCLYDAKDSGRNQVKIMDYIGHAAAA